MEVDFKPTTYKYMRKALLKYHKLLTEHHRN